MREAVRAIAVDYDRTLTGPEDAIPERAALAALARAREAGVRVIVVSGRGVAFLEETVGSVADAIVAENGGLLRAPSGVVKPLGELPRELADALDALGVDAERGETLRSYDITHEPRLREALARAGSDATLVRNRDRVMVLPRGVDKAVGLLAALELLRVAPAATVAFGDGENDAPMLRAVGCGVAVANAAPELRAVASEVTRAPGGRGVAEWLARRLPNAREAEAS